MATKNKGTLRICDNGHRYYKSSDCPTCPACEKSKKSTTGFMTALSAPAQRALTNAGITTVKKLSTYTEKEILALHGLGPASLPVLKSVLAEKGLNFKSKK